MTSGSLSRLAILAVAFCGCYASPLPKHDNILITTTIPGSTSFETITLTSCDTRPDCSITVKPHRPPKEEDQTIVITVPGSTYTTTLAECTTSPPVIPDFPYPPPSGCVIIEKGTDGSISYGDHGDHGGNGGNCRPTIPPYSPPVIDPPYTPPTPTDPYYTPPTPTDPPYSPPVIDLPTRTIDECDPAQVSHTSKPYSSDVFGLPDVVKSVEFKTGTYLQTTSSTDIGLLFFLTVNFTLPDYFEIDNEFEVMIAREIIDIPEFDKEIFIEQEVDSIVTKTVILRTWLDASRHSIRFKVLDSPEIAYGLSGVVELYAHLDLETSAGECFYFTSGFIFESYTASSTDDYEILQSIFNFVPTEITERPISKIVNTDLNGDSYLLFSYPISHYQRVNLDVDFDDNFSIDCDGIIVGKTNHFTAYGYPVDFENNLLSTSEYRYDCGIIGNELKLVVNASEPEDTYVTLKIPLTPFPEELSPYLEYQVITFGMITWQEYEIGYNPLYLWSYFLPFENEARFSGAYFTDFLDNNDDNYKNNE